MIEKMGENCFRKKRLAKPYVVKIIRSAAAGSTFVLLGYNRYGDVDFYGSSPSVSYQVSGGTSTYEEFINQSSDRPFWANKWSILSDTPANLQQVLNVTYRNANGRAISDVILLNDFLDMYQSYGAKIDFDFPTLIDGAFYITGTIQVSSDITFLIYPEVIANKSKLLYDEGDMIEDYEEPIQSNLMEYLKKLRDAKSKT